MIFIRVVFPEPDGPMIATVSAAFTSRERLLRTIPRCVKDFEISFIESICLQIKLLKFSTKLN
jgi:hypothetical protein